jgi:hypothetical protein
MSVTKEETEITLYAKLDDPESLKEAENIEDHVQLEVIVATGAKTRVRKIVPVKGQDAETGERFEYTIKQKLPDDAGVPSSLETTQDVDRNFYVNFAGIAHRAIVKRRYSFQGAAPKMNEELNLALPAVKYEVDQFINPNTKKPSEWIKIDIEIDEVLKALREQNIDTTGLKQRFNLSNLPFIAADMFSPMNMDEQQKKLLGDLWEKEFAQVLAPEVLVKPKEDQGIQQPLNNPQAAQATEQVSKQEDQQPNDPARGDTWSEGDNPTSDAGLAPEERSDG